VTSQAISTLHANTSRHGVDMASIKVGTFNLNNLFSRFNFRADVADGETITSQGETVFRFNEEVATLRQFEGRLVRPKHREETAKIAARIRKLDLDVLAVQEVEDIDTLRNFVRGDLSDLYPFITLIEGNDPRLIDVGMLSKLPLGPVTSWRHVPDPDKPNQPLFSRDLLQVEVMDAARTGVLFTVFNNHLKSHLILDTDPEPVATDVENERRRRRQAEGIRTIIRQRMLSDAPFLVTGDLNDPIGAEALVAVRELGVVDGLADPRETQPYTDPIRNPTTKAWTHRFKESGQDPKFELFDQMWLSPALAARQTDAVIDRRSNAGGDGSDHDPAYVALDF
jgi:endonuclease/exonuclease/phosphatase family metal-dependent hydrolase